MVKSTVAIFFGSVSLVFEKKSEAVTMEESVLIACSDKHWCANFSCIPSLSPSILAPVLLSFLPQCQLSLHS